MIRSVVLALFLLLSTSAASFGQARPVQGQARPVQQMPAEDPGPIGTLLLWKAQLELTESQVTRLTEIEAAVDRQNQQPIEQLTEIRRRLRNMGSRHRLDTEGKAQYDSYTASMRPLAKQLETNMRDAMTQAAGLLTDSQRREVWQLMQQQQQRDKNRDRNSNPPRTPGAGN